MTLKKSKVTGNLCAQCDDCFEIMDFEDDEHFRIATSILRASGWVPSKQRDDKWTHKCPDCVKGAKA